MRSAVHASLVTSTSLPSTVNVVKALIVYLPGASPSNLLSIVL